MGVPLPKVVRWIILGPVAISEIDLHLAERVEKAAERRQVQVDQAMSGVKGQWANVVPALRALKRHCGVTDQDIAEVLGLTRQTVQNRFAGKTAIAPWELAGLAAFFDLPEAVLFDGPDEAIRWVLDHPSDVRLRNRCFAMSDYDESLKIGA